MRGHIGPWKRGCIAQPRADGLEQARVVCIEHSLQIGIGALAGEAELSGQIEWIHTEKGFNVGQTQIPNVGILASLFPNVRHERHEVAVRNNVVIERAHFISRN